MVPAGTSGTVTLSFRVECARTAPGWPVGSRCCRCCCCWRCCRAPAHGVGRAGAAVGAGPSWAVGAAVVAGALISGVVGAAVFAAAAGCCTCSAARPASRRP